MKRPEAFADYDPYGKPLNWSHVEGIALRARKILGNRSLAEIDQLAANAFEAVNFCDTFLTQRTPAIAAIHTHRSMNSGRFGKEPVPYELLLAALCLRYISESRSLLVSSTKSARTNQISIKTAVQLSHLITQSLDALHQAEVCETNRSHATLRLHRESTKDKRREAARIGHQYDHDAKQIALKYWTAHDDSGMKPGAMADEVIRLIPPHKKVEHETLKRWFRSFKKARAVQK